MDSSPVMLQLLNSTTNPGQPCADKSLVVDSLQIREPPRFHLAAKGCPRFVVEFNNCSITREESMLLISLLQGASHLSIAASCYRYCSLRCSVCNRIKEGELSGDLQIVSISITLLRSKEKDAESNRIPDRSVIHGNTTTHPPPLTDHTI